MPVGLTSSSSRGASEAGAVRARKQHDAVEIGQDAGDEGALALTERDIHPHHTHPLLELTPSHTQPEE